MIFETDKYVLKRYTENGTEYISWQEKDTGSVVSLPHEWIRSINLDTRYCQRWFPGDLLPTKEITEYDLAIFMRGLRCYEFTISADIFDRNAIMSTLVRKPYD